MSIRIAIVEDQPKVTERLLQRLSFFEELEVIFTADGAKQTMDFLRGEYSENLPHVILMDIEMPGKSGIELTAAIKQEFSEIDILIQTVFEDDEKIFNSIEAGASGYLLKDDPIDLYIDAITQLYNGKAVLSPSIAIRVMNYVKDNTSSKKEQAQLIQQEFSLSDREVDILKGIVDDMTEHQIGEQLFISHHTVRTHIKNIYRKLHVHSRASAVRFALSKGLIQA